MAFILVRGLVLVLLALYIGGGLLWQWWYRRTHTLEQWEHWVERRREPYRQVKADLHERYGRAKHGDY